MMLLGLGAACSGDGGAGDGPRSKGLDAADRSVRSARTDLQPKGSGTTPIAADVGGARAAALMGNDAITWSELSAPLGEAAGAVVLEEVCLDRLIAREMQVRSLALDAGATEREEQLLLETLTANSGLAPGQEGELLRELRTSRGLGERRYSALLKRNAMLRRMVRDDVVVTPTDVSQAHEIRYGQRFQTRLILTRGERDAADALARVRAGERFADVTMSASVDPSRLRGGFLGDISPADPSFPLALRKAIAATPVGTPSGVLALDQGYAVVLVEQVQSASSVQLESVAAELEREVRLVRERGAMDRLAGQLLRAANITVLDPSLQWSWKERTGAP
jgi:foldase protein PrsA